jgi:putative phosphoribosyl transferase
MTDRFKNRNDAGRSLAKAIIDRRLPVDVVYAIPRGGVEVAAPIAQALKVPLQVVFIRKLPYPFSPEMGFGSVDENGKVLINPEAAGDEELTDDVVEPIAKQVHAEVLRRKKEFFPYCPTLAIEEKNVLLVDDGIATGSSLRAAVHFLKSFRPKTVWIATGCGYGSSIEWLKTECDGVICLITQHHGPFAVATYYDDFRDRSDEEIKEMLIEVNQPWLKS